uniref:Uncharacterized protein n=1 Tax=viral metagenome TaxID=1070528 RepID=A0A6M3MF45_9ZZZZ
MSKETANINIRVTPTLRKIIERYVEIGTYINISDFGRDALREKIRRDAPKLLEEINR